jgi:GMP synthase-like glutamine amidotransferase
VTDPDDIEALKRKIISTIPTIPERHRMDDVRIAWADQKREFRVENLPRNRNVPSLDSLEEKQKSLQERLWRITTAMRGYLTRKPTLDARTYKPIHLIEFKDCFTNQPMRKLLRGVMGGVEAVEYMDIHEVDLQKGFDEDSLPELNGFQIIIMGGSLADTDDEHAKKIIEEYFVPLLAKISRGIPIMVFGTCFSHQGLLEAFGMIHGMDVRFATIGGAVQFGGFPIRVPTQLVYEDDAIRESHNRAFKYLKLKENDHQLAVAFTRSGYTYVDGYQKIDDISAIAYDITGRNEQSSRIPPAAFDLFHGKVIITQFHPEIMLSQEEDRQQLRETLNVYAPDMQMKRIPEKDRDRSSTYPPYAFYQNVDLAYRNALGSVRPWIVSDMGPAFMMGVLDNFTLDLESAINTNFHRR